MIASIKKILSDNNRGASITEVLLAMAIVAVATPFVYNQITQTNHSIHDIAMARQIMSVRDSTLNFIRMNQDKWPDIAQIRLSEEELANISDKAVAGLIDKYSVSGATITDVYLAFEMDNDRLRTNKIARHIGGDAAVVGDDSIAYGSTWAVAAPDFVPGDLIYRISRDVAGEDTSRYLHRATSGEDNLNVMERNLDMAYHHVYNVATMTAESAKIKNGNATFVETEILETPALYFSSGANIDSADVSFGTIRVTGDMTGFRNVFAEKLNGDNFTTTGRVITDRTTVTDSLNVANNLVLKSDSVRTVSGFTGISANTVFTPHIFAEEMIFYNDFGLTVSGELLMSTVSPLKIGNWVFPSTKPPVFSEFNLTRGALPSAPSRNGFAPLMQAGWQINTPYIQTTISTIN